MKKILIILTLCLLTGCSVDYGLIINNNNTLDETIYFTETNEVLSKYGEPISTAVNNIKEFYLSGENDIEPQIIVANKANFKNNNGQSATYKLKKNIDNIQDFSKSLFFNYYFETSKITNDSATYTIYGNKFNYDNVKKLTTSYKYTFDVDNIVIKIQSYYDVIDSNATKIDKKTNTHYWVVNENNASNFELKLTYSKKNKYTYNEKSEPNVIEKITGNIVEKVSFGKVNGTEFVKNNKIVPIILIGIVLTIILVIVLFIKKKIEKTNRI